MGSVVQPNLALKIAIVASGKRQRELAARTGIPENRLSTIVNGWVQARDQERQEIAAALGKTVEELFGTTQEAA